MFKNSFLTEHLWVDCFWTASVLISNSLNDPTLTFSFFFVFISLFLNRTNETTQRHLIVERVYYSLYQYNMKHANTFHNKARKPNCWNLLRWCLFRDIFIFILHSRFYFRESSLLQEMDGFFRIKLIKHKLVLSVSNPHNMLIINIYITNVIYSRRIVEYNIWNNISPRKNKSSSIACIEATNGGIWQHTSFHTASVASLDINMHYRNKVFVSSPWVVSTLYKETNIIKRLFYMGFLSQTFTTHGATEGREGEGGGGEGLISDTSLPLPPASQTLRH